MAPLTQLSGEPARPETRDPDRGIGPEPAIPKGGAAARLALVVTPKWCAWRSSAIAAVLVGLHVWVHVLHYRFATVPWGVRSLFDLDREQGLGTWFSSLLLLAAGLASLACARVAAERDRPRAPWRWLGPGLVLLSIDEVAGFHEIFNTLTEVSWAIPAAGLVGLCAICSLPALLKLPRRTALWLAIGGTVYFGGAVGVELASALHFERLDHLAYELSVAIEEGLEMAGAIVLLVTTLDFLAQSQRSATDWVLQTVEKA